MTNFWALPFEFKALLKFSDCGANFEMKNQQFLRLWIATRFFKTARNDTLPHFLHFLKWQGFAQIFTPRKKLTPKKCRYSAH